MFYSRSLTVAFFIMFGVTASSAQAPSAVSFQGYLTDAVGDPITAVGLSVQFRLLDEGVERWKETQSVDVVGGVFNVSLGTSVRLDTMAFSDSLDLAIKVDTDPEMAPVPLLAAAYARSLPGMYTFYVDDGTSQSYNVVGGSPLNTLGADVVGATISGGGNAGNSFDFPNSATASYATVGGGHGNSATRPESTVGGGAGNKATGSGSTVGGGLANTASGIRATVPGGEENSARGQASFAAGHDAKAKHDGTFVWNDLSVVIENDSLVSTGPNQFLIRAAGGVGIGTNAPAGPVHIVEAAFGVDAPELESDDLIIESTDAIIGAYSPKIGAWGSGIILGEVESNALNNKWAMLRQAGAEPHLHFKFGTSAAYHTNPTVLRIGTNGVITSWAHFRPDANNTRDLGTGSERWRDIYLVNTPTVTSDLRMKRDVVGLGYGLQTVLDLQPVSYRWRAEEAGDVHLGLIAQNVETVIPEIVQRDDGTDGGEDDRLGIRYTELIPVLIKAIQEQQETIHAQSGRIDALEALLTN